MTNFGKGRAVIPQKHDNMFETSYACDWHDKFGACYSFAATVNRIKYICHFLMEDMLIR